MTARISLCMIVRDEAAMLPAFLEAARGAWDELVAVDTGSVDATPELLAGAGATVIAQPWGGDFAAARNFGLQRASGDWVLVLDADERVSPELAAALRQVAADARYGAASLLVVNELPHGHWRRSRLLRMFRNGAGIRFRHAIHESAGDDVASFLSRTGLRRADLAGTLLHLGYVREHAAARRKRERDVGILRRTLERDPSDLYAHLKLLEQARFWNDSPLRAAAAEGLLRELERGGVERLRAAHFAGELLALAVDGLGARPAEALAWLDGFAGLVTPSAAYELRRGELRELAGDAAGARDAFLRCLSLEAVTDDLQLATVRPRMGLARLALAKGDLDDAAKEAAGALAFSPSDPEALLLLATLHRLAGGPGALARFAGERRAATGDSDELRAAVREAAQRAGDAA